MRRIISRSISSHSASKMTQPLPISQLPLPSAKQLLIHNLTPDARTASVPHFRNSVLSQTPSYQRRARLLSPESHFSFVTPLTLPFPYEIEPPEPPAVIDDKDSYIEDWLAKREATVERAPPERTHDNGLRVYDSDLRQQPRRLIGLAETGLRDCLPHLDVGNSLEVIGEPSLLATDSPASPENPLSSSAQELVDILGGHSVLMSSPDAEVAFAPWSLRYSGHQFGVWAGQLGDGRATSVLVTPHPNDPSLTYEVQLKGSGRTPFSRSADGLAVTRSSIREFLCSEAMYALGIPTTRSLSLISLPELSVIRERVEHACVLARVAPSFLRIGSFEALSPPQQVFFLGGGQQDAHYDALLKLGEWVSRQVLKLDEQNKWAKAMVLEITKRNALMVAGWQVYGFMHGVINTDNVSVLGLTIDYGPYAFMDVYEKHHICNHTDEEGRYAYDAQPTMILYAMRALLNALAPLIGAEASLPAGESLQPGWAKDATEDQLNTWRQSGQEETKEEMERVFEEVSRAEYGRLMSKRLGLRRQEHTDDNKLVVPLLSMMSDNNLDFHQTFRTLCAFKPSDDLSDGAFVSRLLANSPEKTKMALAEEMRAKSEWKDWLAKYAQRIQEEIDAKEWTDVDEREREMKLANPKFVLRQWLLEEVIAKVEADEVSGRQVLAKILKMASEPFKPWGGEDEENTEKLNAEEREERRLCGLGAKNMLGFQCSCSS